MAADPILVLGASGTTGRRLARRLHSAGAEVRAASRQEEVRFDWTDPETCEPAVAGVARIYLMAPHGQPVESAFVPLAVDQGVRRVVLLSSRGIEVMGDERLIAAGRAVRESGAEWTVVRSDWFNQNFDEGPLPPSRAGGQLALPLGNHREAFVDADDIAAVAATALTGDGHAGRSYELMGPRALSFPEALEVIGRAAGRSIRYHGTPRPTARAGPGDPRRHRGDQDLPSRRPASRCGRGCAAGPRGRRQSCSDAGGAGPATGPAARSRAGDPHDGQRIALLSGVARDASPDG